MADVFLSYAREDAVFAQRLAERLQEAGLRVFWDRHVPLGSSWDRVLERELATASCVVVLWSRLSADSDWVRLEATDAADRGVLIPALLEPVTVPLRFRMLQAIDLDGWRRNADKTALAPLLAAVCAVTRRGDVAAATSASPPRGRLRSDPVTLSGKALTATLIGHGCFDRRHNPAGRGAAHDYRPLVAGEDVALSDAATGLTWQHGGSEREMVFAATDAYLHTLNTASFAGFDDWRLPTVEEAGTLLEPVPQDGLHVSPVFGRGVNFIWTADRHPDGRVWMVYFHDGYFARETAQFNAWVRAVRSTHRETERV